MNNALVTRIREFYDRNPEALLQWQRHYYTPLEKALKSVEISPPKDLSLPSLDALQDSTLAKLLIHLPVQEAEPVFGADALFWTGLTYPTSRGNDYLKQICHLIGMDTQRLEKARLSIWRHLAQNDAQTVLATYTVLDSLNNGLLKTIDLPRIVETHARRSLRKENIPKYSFAPLNTERDFEKGYEKTWGRLQQRHKDRAFSIYLDTPVGIGLFYNERPGALAGILPSSSTCLSILQLQPVAPYVVNEKGELIRKDGNVLGLEAEDRDAQRTFPHGIGELYWQELLLDITRYVAQELGFTQVSIQSAHNNPLTLKDRRGRINLPLEIGLTKYDAFARAQGFYKGDDNNWYENISSHPCTRSVSLLKTS